MEKAVGLDHDHTASAAIRMAIGQPEEMRRFRFLGHAGSVGRELATFNSALSWPSGRPCVFGRRAPNALPTHPLRRRGSVERWLGRSRPSAC
jgi:hypothetical protein